VTRAYHGDGIGGQSANAAWASLRVRIAKWILPRKYGVVREVGWEDIRV